MKTLWSILIVAILICLILFPLKSIAAVILIGSGMLVLVLFVFVLLFSIFD